ncbi:FAD-dependent oxidoreductase [Streptomyces sp. NPDC060028]|uniref:FAD-dependent oxidoreductase n=1 Tax=Streptomyces sp. NPDC060028 TaxID=3347041 RepID=UPI0036891FFC
MVTARPLPAQAQVLVVGAGPAGLTTAHELARRGLRVRLVDAAAGPSRAGGAVAVHPRTLETLDQMGLARHLLEHGRSNSAFTVSAGGRPILRLDTGDAGPDRPPTRFPYTVVIEQSRTEELLREALLRLGVRVEWGVRLTGLTQDAERVRVRLRHGGAHGEAYEERREERHEEYEVPWLVGCDGRHSTVRERLRLPLRAAGTERWELADVHVTAEDLPQDSVHWVHTGGGRSLLMLPYACEGRWRLLAGDPAAPDADPRPAHERYSALLSAGLGREVRVGEPEWSCVRTFKLRTAERMHEGRCFIAGEAAHGDSPGSGQGMNTGIQEAYNLGWKLAMVEHGWAGRELLDTYGQERVPVGRALLEPGRESLLARFAHVLAGLALPALLGLVRRTGLLDRVVRPFVREAVRRRMLCGTAGLGLGYPDSPLSTPPQGPGGGPGGPGLPAGSRAAGAAALFPGDPGTAGLRAELRDVRWSLLYVPEATGEARQTARAALERYGAWLSVRTVAPDRVRSRSGPRLLADPGGRLRQVLGMSAGSWLLVRPDGYAAGGGPELTEAALAAALAPVGPRPAPLLEVLRERESRGMRRVV